jgi:hypothetical protein
MRSRELFLRELISELRYQNSQWVIRDHLKVEWIGQPKTIWPEADVSLKLDKRHFIIEYDEDSDPVRSLTKYWPILNQANEVPITIIEVWKRGSTIGFGFAELSKWIGRQIQELYPNFSYKFIERVNESARTIASEVAEIITLDIKP